MPRSLLKNWISSYAETLSPISEAPDQYIIWSAISVISAVLKKKVWVWRGTYQVYSNQYIVLVGPPGVGKGSAIHPAYGFIKNFKTPMLSNFLSDRVTAEEILKRLELGFPTVSVLNGNIINSTESTAVIMAAELSTFLSSSEWMTGFLCGTWDQSEYEYGTKNKGSNSITGMCISLVGACVPNFIRKINGKTNSSEAINSGFTARTIFVFANEKSKKLPWPVKLEDTKNGKQMILDLRNDLEHISKLKGEYTFSQEARDLFTQWYNKLGPTDTDSDVIRHFKSRQDVHVMKVAMCFAAATSDKMEIDRWCLSTAIALVQGVLNTLDVTFRGVGESSLSEATAKVQSYMERKGLASRAELVRDMQRHCTMEDLDRIIFTLETIGILKKPIISGRQYYEHTNSTKPKGVTP